MGATTSTDSASTPADRAPRMLSLEEAKSLPIVTHEHYALLALHVYKDPDSRPIPDGWRVLLECSDVHLDKEGFYAIAYVNDSLRHCVIAERGTADALGIRAGVWMYFDEPTIQFTLADQFTKLVKLRLEMTRGGDSQQQSPYVLSFTGHSLGGVLAACQACAEHTFAVTFENPGCRKFVDLTMHPFKAEDVDIITYLRQPNPINTLRPHCGYLVQLPYRPALPADHLVKGVAMSTAPASGSKPTASGGGGGSPQRHHSPTAGSTGPTMKTGTAGATEGSPSPPRRAASSAAESAQGALHAARRMMVTLTTPHEFLRSKVLEASVPELQQYLSRVEPVIKELLDQTQQVHGMAGIVDSLAKAEGSHQGQDVVLVWPSHILQFLEYFNITREMADPANQQANLYQAYQQLLSRLYQTESRPKHKMPIKFLNRDSQRLLAMYLLGSTAGPAAMQHSGVHAAAAGSGEITSDSETDAVSVASSGGGGDPSAQRRRSVSGLDRRPATGYAASRQRLTASAARTLVRRATVLPEEELLALSRPNVMVQDPGKYGLTELDMRFLASLSIQGQIVSSAVLPAFSAKQYLAILTMRPIVRARLDQQAFVSVAPVKSKQQRQTTAASKL